MGKNTKIAWTHHTFNPWWGCTEVSPACDNCYARSWAKRTGFGQTWPDPNKPDAPAVRRLLSPSYWRDPLHWDEKCNMAGRRERVFAGSMCDIFDTDGPEDERRRLFRMIKATPSLDWLLLTKRIGNAKRMLPPDWAGGYNNVWLGSTVVTREEFERDVPKLRVLNAAVRFLSIEPLFEQMGNAKLRLDGIHWVIVGGESGPNARPLNEEWAYRIARDCASQGVAFFMKQLSEANHPQTYLSFKDFPPELQVRQWPRSTATQDETA